MGLYTQKNESFASLWCQVKLWSTRSGFCFVTFSQHTAAVTALAFVGGVSGKGSGKSVKGIGPKSKTTAEDGAGGSLVHVGGKGVAVLSASSDGTVRAFDLVRYRNFRTMTTPSPVQFMSLAADPGGKCYAVQLLISHQCNGFHPRLLHGNV